jgi:hypothetical protein
MYSAVPTTVPAFVCPASPNSRAMPKSASFTEKPSRGSSRRSRFAGFRSRCTTP